jgi:hypothetical protein
VASGEAWLGWRRPLPPTTIGLDLSDLAANDVIADWSFE